MLDGELAKSIVDFHSEIVRQKNWCTVSFPSWLFECTRLISTAESNQGAKPSSIDCSSPLSECRKPIEHETEPGMQYEDLSRDDRSSMLC